MSLSSIGSRRAVCCGSTASVSDVVRRMQEHDVGSVVVLEGGRPVGIVTDRDLVLRVLRVRLDPAEVPVSRVMSAPLVTASDDLSPLEAASLLRERRVRRLPLIGADGALTGIVTLDDLLHHVGRTTAEMADVIGAFPVPRVGG